MKNKHTRPNSQAARKHKLSEQLARTIRDNGMGDGNKLKELRRLNILLKGIDDAIISQLNRQFGE